MIKHIPYQSFGLGLVIFMASFLSFPTVSFGQDTGGKKLEVSEKSSPTKMDNQKVKTSKKRKTKGNPNRGSNKVIVINPFKWDWDKVMWFKVKKSYYETKDYNPDKRPKRKAITNPSELGKPLIPYDSRIADEGPVLQKKQKHKNVNSSEVGPQVSPPPITLPHPSETLTKSRKKDRESKVDGKKLYTATQDKNRKPFNNSKLETASAPDLEPKMDEGKIMFRKQKDDYPKLDNDKLMVAERPDYKSNKPDGDKLMIVEVKDGKRNKFDNKKLMISEPANRERKPFDNSKLMTATVSDKERKPFDNEKLMTARPANPDRKQFDNSKLMTATINKPKKQDLHDDRLLTVIERKKPTDEMKESSKDISKLEGDYQRHFYVTSESHPGTKILAAEHTNVPFLAKTFQSVSLFLQRIWSEPIQPKYVTRKQPKERRDKKEGQIWDNSVHPSEWKKQEAESGEQ